MAMLSRAAKHAAGTLPESACPESASPESACPESASPTVRRLCRSLLLPILLIGLPAQVAAQTAGVTLSSSTQTVAQEDRGTDRYTVVLNTLPVGNVAVMVTSGDTATFTVAPLMLTFATSNWNQPQTVTVTGVNDDTHNTGDERTGTITHTISTADGGAYTTGLELDSVAVTVMDDDDPTLTVSLPNGETTIEEGGDPTAVRMTADPEPGIGDSSYFLNQSLLTVLSFSPGYRRDSLDSADFSFDPDLDFEFDIADNDDDQPNGTVTIDISVMRGFSAGSPSMVTLTIIDNDPTEVSLIRTGTGAIDEGGTVAFTVQLSRALIAGEIIDVPLSVTGTDVEPADWSLSATGTGVVLSNENTMTPLLRFENAGAQTAELTLTAIGDDTVEGGGSETYVIALGLDGDGPNGFDHSSLNTNVGGGADPHSGSNAFSVQVNDVTVPTTVGITVNPASVTVAEDSGIDSYTVVLNTLPVGNVAVMASGDTATFTVAPPTLTFTISNWNQPQTVTVTGVNDDTHNTGDERTGAITHTISTADGGAYTTVLELDSVTVTVMDDDDPTLTVSLPNSETTIEEGGGSIRVRMTADLELGAGDSSRPLNQHQSSVLFFSPGYGWSSLMALNNNFDPDLEFEFEITDNDDDQPNGTLTIDISVVRGFTAGSPSMVTLTIIDNDPTEVSLIRTGTGAIDEGGTVAFTVQLSRALVAGEIIDVPLSVTGTDVEPADWSLSATGTGVVLSNENTMTPLLRFENADAQTAELTLTAIGDDTVEGGGSETYVIALGPDGDGPNGFDHSSLNTNVGGGADPHSGSNTFSVQVNDVTVPTTVGITVNPASVTVAEDSGIDSYTVVLNTLPVGNVAVMASGDTATFTVAPPILTFTISNWNQPQTVTVTGVNDDTHNTGDERTGTITHTISTADGGAYTTVLELDSVTVTVTDDDDPTLTVSLPNGGTTIEEGGSSILARFTADPPVAQRLGNPSNFITLTTGYTTSVNLVDDLLGIPVDYEYSISDNNMDQPNGTLTIHVSDSRFAAGSPSMVTLPIIDNDPTEVSLIRTGSTGAIDEGQAVTFTVELGRALIAGEIIEVPLSVTGTDVEPADWSLSATGTGVVLSNENTMTPLLRFENADAQTAELTLTANGDDTLEGGGSETYVIALGPDGDVPNGFDQDSLNTNVGGGADPHSGSNTFSVQVDDPTLTVSLPNGETTIEEGGSSITARFTVDPPVADVLGTPDDFITLTTGYSLTSSLTSGLLTRPVDVEYFIDEFDENNMDQPNGTMTIHVSDPLERFAAGSPSMVTLTVIDNDPTEVSLIRTGSTGAIDEGQAVTFTVELGRALVAGEIIEVPLSVTGIDVEPADWSLSATGTGVVLSNENTMTPLLRFEDAGAQTAELTLTANGDNMVEGGGSETYVIALGLDGDGPNGFDHSSLNTNVGGGADPHSGSNTFSVQVNDATVMPMITITGGTTVTEGMGSASFTLTATPAPTDALTLMLNVTGGSDFIATSGAQTVALNSGSSTVTYLIATQGDAVDEPNGTVTVTVGDGTGYEVGDPSVASVGVHDDDATTVTLAGDPGNVAEGDSKPLTLTLGRALEAGEQLTVRLTFGGTATFGTDYTLTGTAANGVDYSDLSGGSVTFSADGQMATLTLMAQTDAVIETGGETVRIVLGTLDSNSGTNLGGGASGTDNLSDFTIEDATVPTTVGITVNPASVTVAEDSGTDSYTVVLNTQPGGNVAMMVTSSDAATFTVAPLMLTFATSNWNQPQAVTVTGVNDDTHNTGDERTGTITHTISTADGGAYTTVLELDSVAVTVMDDDDPTLTVSLPNGDTTIEEGGSSITARFTADPPVSQFLNDPRTFRTLTTGYGGGEAVVSDLLETPVDVEYTISENNMDQPNGTMTIHVSDPRFAAGSPSMVTLTIIDNDPTEVSLIRTGSTGAIDEGQAVTFTIELGRALVAGEIIDVPLSVTGTDVEPADWSLSATGTGVVLSNENTMTPLLRFENAGAQTAELTLTANGDNTVEGGGSETYVIALGLDGDGPNGFDHSSLNTNVGGGADPHSGSNTFSVQVNDVIVMPMITITGGATVTEGMGSASFTLTATPAPTDALTLMLNVTGGSGFIATSGAQTVALNSGSSTVTYLIATQGDAVDEANGTVTVTVGDGTGYEVGDPSVASVGVHDDDATPVTLAGDPGNVAEGDSKPLTLTLGRALEAGEQLTVRLTFGGTATFGTDYTLTGTTANGVDYSDLSGGSVTFSAGGQIATLTLMARTDAVVETGGELVRIGLGTLDSNSGTNLGGGASGTDNLADFTIEDATVPTTVGITANPASVTVAEDSGTDSYTVVLNMLPVGNVAVMVTSSDAATFTVAPLMLTFATSNWNQPQAVTVTGVNDDTDNTGDERTGTITHTISTADGGAYTTVLELDSVAVTVTDDDDPTLTEDPAIVLTPATAISLIEGSTTSYTVALATEPTAEVVITLSGVTTALRADTDADMVGDQNTLTFSSDNWNEAQIVTLTAGTDSNALSNRVILTHMASGGNYDDALVVDLEVVVGSTEAMQAAQSMWLPRFGLTAIEHMLGGLHHRFAASDQPGLSGNLNGLPRGQSFNAARLLSSRGGPDASVLGIEQLGAGSSDRPRKLSRTLSLPKLLPSMLRGSHFTLSDEDGTSIWGRASYSSYKDADDGTSIDGEVTTAMLGVDHSSGRTLLGLALAYSDSDGEWQGQGESDKGELSGTLASLLPYLRYDLTERLQLWGAASYGRGDLEQTSETTGVESEHDLEQVSATLGLRGTLLDRPVEEGGLSLKLISDMTLARIEADDSGVMAGTEADTQRFRMGLEWSWQLPEGGGMRLTPELELGLRYDGGDTSEGFGLELGGGLNWQLPARGLTFDVRSRYLLEHEASGREEWGLSGSLRYKARPDSAHGPSFSLRHEYGNAPAASGLDRLLSDSLTDALKEDNADTADVSSRWTLKGEWGFALMDDATGIPYASLSASDAKRDLTLGWRLLSNPAGLKSKLDIKAIRREQDDNNPRHSVGAEWKLNW